MIGFLRLDLNVKILVVWKMLRENSGESRHLILVKIQSALILQVNQYTIE